MSEARLYTTRLQAGLGLVDETLALLELYRSGMSVRELYTAALDSGRFPTMTARRLLNLVQEGFAPRYMEDPEVAAILKRLAEYWQRDELIQLFMLYTARANCILADFIREVFWPRYMAGFDELSRDDATAFVEAAVREGRTQKPWAPSTVRRVASYLLGTCTDFGLLGNCRLPPRPIRPVRIHPRVATYLAYNLRGLGFADRQIIRHPDWGLFGLEGDDVRQQLKRLAPEGHFIVQSAGDVTQITWGYRTMGEAVNALAGH
ncbi:hypothetical protein HH1059_20080 [Halorhodospira halochloris]|uniref:Uncharacterized protein n=1 Tax=Halorhodospira halochloris TaxID=1052 RepID=A0A0X8XBQ4_HALHR|nr:BrxA family protein [Halorhodospira halochloris]MBK1652747.1 hypothetical protein [Halorhodospira halochloris]BAU58712.1 hypothetical protein HH1059_20080 [Halorhodospira halochloris]